MLTELSSARRKKKMYWDVIFFAAAGALITALISVDQVKIKEQQRQIQALEQSLSEARKEIDTLKKMR